MKYFWEESDITPGRTAILPQGRAVTILVDPFSRQEHRKWRVVFDDESSLSCEYSTVEVASWLTTMGFAPL